MSWGNGVVTGLIVFASVSVGVFWLRQVRSNLLHSVGSMATAESDPILSRVITSGPMACPRDGCRVAEQPQYLFVVQAADSMRDGAVVLGLELAAEGGAYSVNYLSDH